MRFHGALVFEALWHAKIVRVHARDPRAARLIEAGVEGADDPVVRVQRKQAHTRIVARGLFDDGACFVGRAVVDDDQFEVAEGLRKHAVDAARRKRRRCGRA